MDMVLKEISQNCWYVESVVFISVFHTSTKDLFYLYFIFFIYSFVLLFHFMFIYV